MQSSQGLKCSFHKITATLVVGKWLPMMDDLKLCDTHNISGFPVQSQRNLLLKQFSGLPCMCTVFISLNHAHFLLHLKFTYEVAYSIDFTSLGNTYTPHTQPSWVLIHQSNTIFATSWLISMLFWSSLLSTPPVDSADVKKKDLLWLAYSTWPVPVCSKLGLGFLFDDSILLAFMFAFINPFAASIDSLIGSAS